jgi:hypothetical protein
MPPKKRQTITLDGEEFDIREGALRQQLQVPKGHKFSIIGLSRLSKIPNGEKFKYLQKEFKMTGLLKRRIVLARLFMEKNKK